MRPIRMLVPGGLRHYTVEYRVTWLRLKMLCATAEAYFLRAEGAMLGWNMGGTAKQLYEAGITNSMKQWGITDATTITNYINSTSTRSLQTIF